MPEVKITIEGDTNERETITCQEGSFHMFKGSKEFGRFSEHRIVGLSQIGILVIGPRDSKHDAVISMAETLFNHYHGDNDPED